MKNEVKNIQIMGFNGPCTVWQYRLRSNQGRDTRLERFLAKNQIQSNEIIEF